MTVDKQAFTQRYTQLVHDYVGSPDETYLAEIEDLGQQMVQAELPPEEIGEMHDLAIAELLASSDMEAKHIRAVSLPLMQLLMAYGVAFRALLAKKEAEARLHLASRAIENTMEGIIITDQKGAMIDANRAFERVTGYSRSEALGNNPSMLHSGKQDADFYHTMWQTLLKEGQWQGKIWNKRKNGEVYPEHLSITAIHDNEGAVVNYVGVFSDITEQLSLEQQLLQAQKMEAIGTMVGGIAHNFNNMLAGMTGNLYLAKKRVGENPDVVQNLANVEELSHHAAEMIQQLLSFARKGMVSMKAMPLTPFIKETLKLLRASVPENIAMNQDVCAHDLRIIGDATQLHQVLANLVNNARDAVQGVDAPCITIKLDLFQPDDAYMASHTYFKAGPYARLCVEDNGCGIPEHQLEHLFEPFFTTKEQGEGTGLGLSMVYGAIKTHHGFVNVDSIKGEGSTFHVYIPLLEEEVPAADCVPKLEAAEGNGELILLADDDAIVREVMAEVLQCFGYQVLLAEDGLKAIELFQTQQQEIALALLDVVMPHLGGMQLAVQLRAVNPDLPVIFLTGYDKDHVVNGGELLPNSNVLTKPVNFDLLSHSIRKLLD